MTDSEAHPLLCLYEEVAACRDSESIAAGVATHAEVALQHSARAWAHNETLLRISRILGDLQPSPDLIQQFPTYFGGTE